MQLSGGSSITLLLLFHPTSSLADHLANRMNLALQLLPCELESGLSSRFNFRGNLGTC